MAGQPELNRGGRTLAAIFAARYPERAAGLILLETPLHFGPHNDPLSALVAASPPASSLTGVFGKIPGSWLNLCSVVAAPGTFLIGRWADALASLADPQAFCTHLRVERWTLDEMLMPPQLFEEVVEWLYREDRLAHGTFAVVT